MDDILLTKENINEFKSSIYTSLNCDDTKINSKLNFDLLETYVKNVLPEEIFGLTNEEILLNPLIIKLSKNKILYNRFATSITNLEYNEYIKNIKKIITDKKNISLIVKYADNFIDVIDYHNPIELEIALIRANLALKDCLKTFKDQKWFITYIINKEAIEYGIKPNISYILIKHIRKSKLYKKVPYIKYNNLEQIDKYSNTIFINLGMFNIIKKIKDKDQALIYLLNTCFKKLQILIRKTSEYLSIYDDKIYRFIKEGIIFKEDSNFYNQNKSYFSSEINLNEQTSNMRKSLKDNPLFSKFEFIKEYSEVENYSSFKNTEDYWEVDNHIDNILVNNPNILKEYPLLQMEYNIEGRRKGIIELIKEKIKQKKIYTDQIENFENIIKETNNDIVKDNIKLKLNTIIMGLPGIIRCHNNMIYKSLQVLSIPDFTKFLEKIDAIYLKDIKEAIIQEKEDIIVKIDSNRRKIFKTATFLKNEEFLTREYSKVARYESKLQDFLKEKEHI